MTSSKLHFLKHHLSVQLPSAWRITIVWKVETRRLVGLAVEDVQVISWTRVIVVK